MQKHQIEAWALAVIERIRTGGTNEDSRVEFKKEWISAGKAARRLAAHANSALGEPILWLIGVDQKTGEFAQTAYDLANWWPSVKSYFDGITPDLVDVALSIDGKTIMALYFDTERRPFVVKSSGDRLEVPWRDGTRVRSANRNELIRLLSAVVDLPNFEVLHANFVAKRVQPEPKPIWELIASLIIYVLPKREGQLIFPFHRASCTVKLECDEITLPQVQLDVFKPSITTQVSTTELIVTGSGSFKFAAKNAIEKLPVMSDKATLRVTITPAASDIAAVLKLSLTKQPSTHGDEIEYRWVK